MSSFDLNSINTALNDTGRTTSGVDFSGKSLKLDTEADAKPIVDAINQCSDLQFLTLTGNTLGVEAAQAIAKALERHPELKICRWSDMFTGRMKSEIPLALSALGDGMIAAGARLSVLDLSDNAFGPIGVEGLAKLLESEVCSQLQELRLNNNGLGITGGRLLAKALAANPVRLKVFIAGRNRLENDGAIALAKVFEQMGTLEELAMPQNGIYHVGVSALCASLRHNPRISCLNLNDNTVGPKGAAALATRMPQLKNLRSINFGDCLLKSKGAKVLAKAFKDNSLQIESLDLSHNEIGREACMELVDSITVLPNSGERLTRVVLQGNSLGGAAHKKAMRDKLGACADLSDTDDSDDHYETDSEEGSEAEEESDADTASGDERSAASEDSATEDAQHTIIDTKIADNLDTSGVEEVASDVGRFLSNPTAERLTDLGPNAAEVIDTHLQGIKDPEASITAYVEATMCVSGLSDKCPQSINVGRAMYTILLQRAAQKHAAQWILANAMLKALRLIKSEDKDYQIRWSLPPCYRLLGDVITAPHFPASLRDTLQFFIRSKMQSLPEDTRRVVSEYPQLSSTSN